MLNTLKATWSSLNKTINVNQRELALGITACTLAGMVAGMLLSPRKNMTIGSHNGCGNHIPAPVQEEEDTTCEQS